MSEGRAAREDKAGEQCRLRVFLCHSSADKPAVRKLCRRLAADGYDPWLDEQRLLPGQDWQKEIPKAIHESHAVAVCLSRASVSKEGYLQKEIKYALDVVDEKPEGTIFLIPVKLEECEVPERLARWQWASLFEPDGYRHLLLALRQRAKSATGVVSIEGPVLRLRSQGSTVALRQAKAMVSANGFYCRGWNEGARGVEHQYETRVLDQELVVADRATGLMWQKGGSEGECFTFQGAGEYARNLNADSFAGFMDWRVPTLEEAMSLMTPEQGGMGDQALLGNQVVHGVMHLDPAFEKGAAPFIWTSDLSESPGRGWVVYFWDGVCQTEVLDFNAYVRAVRSL
jgi:hypothetical protein